MNHFNLVNVVVVFVESRVSSEINVMDLEVETGFSIAHIRRVFRSKMGVSLAFYIQERRINLAAYQIKQSNKSLTEIAYSFQFDSYDTFARSFKRHVGMTPSEFRKSSKKVEISYLSSGIFAPQIQSHHREESIADRNFADADHQCIIFGVPHVDFGYGVKSTFPACLVSGLKSLGQNVDYNHVMTSCGAAFRLRWNIKSLDLGNVNILNTFEDRFSVVDLIFRSVGRTYRAIYRNQVTSKDDFTQLIKSSINHGKPCIAIGIIGPSEACLVTGYLDGGKQLLGYSLFQNEPQFCGATKIDPSGYFICSDWWENASTIAVYEIGEESCESNTIRETLLLAKKVLTTTMIGPYAGGQLAYDHVERFLTNDTNWIENRIDSLIIEQIIAFGDLMVMMSNRNSAEAVLRGVKCNGEQQSKHIQLIAERLENIARIPEVMTALVGGWSMNQEMIDKFQDRKVRSELAKHIRQAKQFEREIIDLIDMALAEID